MGLYQELRTAVSGHGHGCSCEACSRIYFREGRSIDAVLVWRLAAAAVLLAGAVILRKPQPVVSLILSAASILAAGYDMFLRAVGGSLRRRRIDESLLMSAAVITAAAIGHGIEGALLMLLYQIGAVLRGIAAARVRQNVDAAAAAKTPEARAVLGKLRSGQGEKNRLEDSVDHFARFYTPAVLVIAVVLAVVLPLALHTTVREGIYRALVLMVIACPCAIVLSVPLAYYAGIGGAARSGILFTDTAAMENAASVACAVFEKSGSLEGDSLRVLAVKSERMDADTLLRIAAHACAYSDGRYAESIKAAYQDTIYIELIQSFQQDPGQGITVEVDGVSILLGLEGFVREHGVDPGEDVSDELSAYLAIDGRYAGRILFGSAVKSGAAEAVRRLTWDDDRTVVMLTEDPAPAAEKFARSAGIARFYGNAGPEKRPELLREVRDSLEKKGALMFIGSAETDAECLKAADIGLAMNGAGSDAALEAADIVVMDGSLAGIASAMTTAKRVRTIQRQNLVAVLAFKLIILLLDILGICPLWLAVLSDAGIALAAILNTLRVFGISEPKAS